ncbi:uncharacterized protein LOC135690109 [Rhopilema esculentum]|uniref:uncharacterized protein LOC135690109 n=1 Tax=Rhopilema esculentum TaxID=499914 RepID=UPI0031DAEF7A|eukprot:gene8347-14315_t
MEGVFKEETKAIEGGQRNEMIMEAAKMFQEHMKTTAKDGFFSKLRENNAQLNLSSIWQGSIASLMSCDNITDDLVKEAMQELETALTESQKLLSERDEEIAMLRGALESTKQPQITDINRQAELLEELENSQKRIMELENELSEIRKKEQRNLSKAQAAVLQTINVSDSTFPECTCYCGSVCNALRDVVEVKKKLEITEQKYSNLKKKIRERRKAEAEMYQQRNTHKLTVADRSPGCVLQ